jgi:hypothetical protein
MVQVVFLAAVLVCIIVAIPASMVFHFRRPRSERNEQSGGSTLGNALQDLDKLVARPSIQYQIEAENFVQRADDDKAGD